MKADPQAALAVSGVELTILGQAYDIPPQPAAEWLRVVLAEGEPFPILGMLGGADLAEVMSALLVGEIDVDELADIQQAALATVSGMQWWEADRIIRSSAAQWRIIGGELGRLGVDLERIPLAQALNIIYVMAVRTMDKDERTRFDFELSTPPPGVDAESTFDARAATAAFVAALGMPPTHEAPSPSAPSAPLH